MSFVNLKPISDASSKLKRDGNEQMTMTTELRCRLTCDSRLSVAAEATVHSVRRGTREETNKVSAMKWYWSAP